MEYSRTKKYAQFRESLQHDREPQVTSNDLAPFADRLNKLDSNEFPSMATLNPTYNESYSLNKEKDDIFTSAKPTSTVDTFRNEYLDEYISEVKSYNRDKGLLRNDNTQINILHELKGEKKEAAPVKSDLSDIMPIQARKNETNMSITSEINTLFDFKETKKELSQEEAFKLMNLSSDKNRREMEAEYLAKATEEPKKLKKKAKKSFFSFDDDDDDDEEEIIVEKPKKVKKSIFSFDDDEEDDDEEEIIVEKSKKVKKEKKVKEVKEIDEYDDEDEEGSSSALNVILAILVIVLIAVIIGFIYYWVVYVNDGKLI